MRGIRKRYLTIAATLGLIMMGWSCAEQSPSISTGLSRASFEAWIAKYAPAAYANPYRDIYIEYIERGPENATRPVVGYSWLSLNYTGKLFDGSVFVTRVDSISRRIGTYAATTHFCNDFISYTTTSTKLCEGLRQALECLRVGDSVRLYIPYDKAYSSSMNVNSGYNGESGVSYLSLPIIFELRLQASITEPFVWERDSTLRYAQLNWGNDFSNDTVGMYRHMVKYNPDGNEITEDSSVYVYYEEYFMDGFLASTNIDTVAAKWDRYDSSGETSYDAMLVQPASGANYTEHKAIFIAVPHMRKGEVADIVTVSTWAQGDSGNSSSTPEILPTNRCDTESTSKTTPTMTMTWKPSTNRASTFCYPE